MLSKIVLTAFAVIWGLGALILLFTELALSRDEEYQSIPFASRLQHSLKYWILSPWTVYKFFSKIF